MMRAGKGNLHPDSSGGPREGAMCERPFPAAIFSIAASWSARCAACAAATSPSACPRICPGTDGEIARLFNEVVSLDEQMTDEFERLSVVVGKEGKISQRGRVRGATGGWETKLRAINELIDDMVQPTAEVARVIGAVAKGDLSQTMTVEIDGRPLRGEFLRIGKIVNTMVEQLASFASEVTRVAREVGTEGKLGGQANGEGRRRHLEGPDRQRQRRWPPT